LCMPCITTGINTVNWRENIYCILYPFHILQLNFNVHDKSD
jgi:hypothetical protein